MKRIEKDGKFYRMRRGKLVEIPPEWVGRTVHPQEIRKRVERAKVEHEAAHMGRANREREALADERSAIAPMRPENPRVYHNAGRREKDQRCPTCKGRRIVDAEHSARVVPPGVFNYDMPLCPKCRGTRVNKASERKGRRGDGEAAP